MRARKALSLVIIGAAALTLTACVGDDPGSDTAEIRVWLVGSHTPAAAREHLVRVFEEDNPGSTLVLEEQSPEGLAERLAAALADADGPDVVELAPAQVPALAAAGALRDLSDSVDALGGDDLLPGLVEAGSFEGALYAAPLFSDARVVLADPTAVPAPPATLGEYVATAKQLTAADPERSGVFLAGDQWRDALPFVWESGGEIAVVEEGSWDAQLSSDASIAGLVQLQDLMMNASRAPREGDGTPASTAYCERRAIQFSGTREALAAAADCAGGTPPPLAYALPGADGGAARTLADGASVGISAASDAPELAEAAVAIMLSDEFQAHYGDVGLIPATRSLAEALAVSPEAQAFARAAGQAKSTPASPRWAEVEAGGVLEELFGAIARGGDVAALAEEADLRIERILNG